MSDQKPPCKHDRSLVRTVQYRARAEVFLEKRPDGTWEILDSRAADWDDQEEETVVGVWCRDCDAQVEDVKTE